jgi:hypothetical protein
VGGGASSVMGAEEAVAGRAQRCRLNRRQGVRGEADGWAPQHSERGGGEFDSNSNFKRI